MPRPTKYTTEMLNKAEKYLNEYSSLDEEIPTIAGLSLYLQVNRDTIYDWAKQEDKHEFSDILRKLMSKQEIRLASKGLNGDFNSVITKLMLTKHGYSDKQDVNQNVNLKYEEMDDDELDEELARLEDE